MALISAKIVPKQVSFGRKTLGKFWLNVGPIFMILPITSSFLIHFWLVKYRIEGLNVLFPIVRKQWINSWYWLNHGFGQTWSNLAKPCEMCPWSWFKGFCSIRTTFGLISTRFGCLFLPANIRENPESENRVMTHYTCNVKNNSFI